MLWLAESTGIAQVENPAASIGVEDSTVQTLAGEPSAVEFATTSVAAKVAMTTPVPEVLATTSVSDEPVDKLPLYKLNWSPSLVLSCKEGPRVHQQGYLQLTTS